MRSGASRGRDGGAGPGEATAGTRSRPRNERRTGRGDSAKRSELGVESAPNGVRRGRGDSRALKEQGPTLILSLRGLKGQGPCVGSPSLIRPFGPSLRSALGPSGSVGLASVFFRLSVSVSSCRRLVRCPSRLRSVCSPCSLRCPGSLRSLAGPFRPLVRSSPAVLLRRPARHPVRLLPASCPSSAPPPVRHPLRVLSLDHVVLAPRPLSLPIASVPLSTASSAPHPASSTASCFPASRPASSSRRPLRVLSVIVTSSRALSLVLAPRPASCVPWLCRAPAPRPSLDCVVLSPRPALSTASCSLLIVSVPIPGRPFREPHPRSPSREPLRRLDAHRHDQIGIPPKACRSEGSTVDHGTRTALRCACSASHGSSPPGRRSVPRSASGSLCDAARTRDNIAAVPRGGP